jgi:pyrimidine operon attenuation protein/uracil phosphoribosyltransferase
MRVLFDHDKLVRTVRRISHEIIERNNQLEDIVLLGVKNNGIPLAKMIYDNVKKFEDMEIPTYNLDISGYRDDVQVDDFERLDIDVTNKTVIIVDDVLFTGRTVRAAMDAIVDLGRPTKIQLAVLIDRGHRELPIRADYVGKNVPTSSTEVIKVQYDKGIVIFNKEEI